MNATGDDDGVAASRLGIIEYWQVMAKLYLHEKAAARALARLRQVALQPPSAVRFTPRVSRWLLHAKSGEVRANAACILGSLNPASALAFRALHLAVTADKDMGVRKAAATSLGAIDGDRAVPVLVDVLARDPHPFVQSAAARALGAIGPPARSTAVGYLVLELAKDEGLATAALDALERIDRSWRESDAARAATTKLLEAGLPTRNRDLAVRALGLIGDRRAIPLLREAVRSFASSETLNAIARIGDANAIDDVIDVLASPKYVNIKEITPCLESLDPQWRRHPRTGTAIKAVLSQLPTLLSEAFGRLEALDPAWWTRREAVEAVPDLLRALEDRVIARTDPCLVALKALEQIGDVRVLPRLLDLVIDPADNLIMPERHDYQQPFTACVIQDAAAEALASMVPKIDKVDEQVLQPLVAEVQRSPATLSLGGIRLLGRVPGESGTTALCILLEDCNSRLPGSRHHAHLVKRMSIVLDALGGRRDAMARNTVHGFVRAVAKNSDRTLWMRALYASVRQSDPRVIDPLLRELVRIRPETTADATRFDDDLRRLLIEAVPFSAFDAALMQHAIIALSSVRNPSTYDSDHVKALCSTVSPVTSNVLHLVAKKENLDVSYSYHPFGNPNAPTCELHFVSYTVDHSRDRRIAADELSRRDNPPYDPRAYHQTGNDGAVEV